ncbi:MAG: restriction endonuclease subunit M [Helicobacter sp.]|nr:restriction endonuclease subunit M [Helicobacter sp.]
MTANFLYYELRKTHTLKELANKLNLHVGTLKRWEALDKIPQNYLHDLNFLSGNSYKIPKENFRSHNEFFTKKEVAKECFLKFLDFLKSHKIDSSVYHFLEPSCGNCSFYDLLPKERRIGIDLEYKRPEILEQNFLEFKPKSGLKIVIVGNPPFGLRGNLALRFINYADFADFIAFILPPLFDSDGKGSPKGRVRGFSLAFSEKLPINSFIYPNGKEVEVATVFQIWVNSRLIDKEVILPQTHKKSCKKFIKIYSLSNGGTPSSTRNKNMLDKCDLYLPSTCFHSPTQPQMKAYFSFESLPNKRGYGIVILQNKDEVLKTLKTIDWERVSFLGTNSSLNLRTSLIEDALIEKGFVD